jgi:hypothetical protein
MICPSYEQSLSVVGDVQKLENIVDSLTLIGLLVSSSKRRQRLPFNCLQSKTAREFSLLRTSLLDHWGVVYIAATLYSMKLNTIK